LTIFSCFQSAQAGNAETAKRKTPFSTLNQSIDPILEDDMLVNSSPPEHDEDPEQSFSDHSHHSNVKSVKDDQHHDNDKGEEVPSPVESGTGDKTHESNSDDDEEQGDLDGDGVSLYFLGLS